MDWSKDQFGNFRVLTGQVIDFRYIEVNLEMAINFNLGIIAKMRKYVSTFMYATETSPSLFWNQHFFFCKKLIQWFDNSEITGFIRKSSQQTLWRWIGIRKAHRKILEFTRGSRGLINGKIFSKIKGLKYHWNYSRLNECRKNPIIF